MSRSRKFAAMPISTKAGAIGLAGSVGGGAFIATNILNIYAQNTLNKATDKNYVDNNGPFPAKSIIEEGDSVDTVMNFLYFNLFISVCIFFLLILLIYFYRNKKEKLLIVAFIFLILMSSIFVYFAYNLLIKIGIISTIYQNSINYSVLINGANKINGIELADNFLSINLLFSISILMLLYFLLILYFNTKILNEK